MEFYTKLSDICNSMFVLGDRVPEGRICRKILRSLPDRFDSKIVALEECRDIDNMKVEELIGSLQTHELHFKAPLERKASLSSPLSNIRKLRVSQRKIVMMSMMRMRN